MSKIITHPGTAHRDDLLSISLVLAKDPKVTVIERREPSLTEINDLNIWVLDVGRILDPKIKAFDHHQREWDECTLSLLLKEWKLWNSAKESLPWLEPTVFIDSNGFVDACKKYNANSKIINKFQTPVEFIFLDMLSQSSIINSTDFLFSALKNIGITLLNRINEYEELTSLIEKKGICKKKKGVPIIIFLDAVASRTLNSVVFRYKAKHFGNIEGGLSIIKDDRVENAIRLYRFNNDERVDLSRLSDNFHVIFLHEKRFLSTVDIPNDKNINDFLEQVVETVIV